MKATWSTTGSILRIKNDLLEVRAKNVVWENVREPILENVFRATENPIYNEIDMRFQTAFDK